MLTFSHMIQLFAHPLPLPPVSKLYLFCLPVCRWSSLLAGRGGGVRGGRGAKSVANCTGLKSSWIRIQLTQLVINFIYD
jgi:hypothetical protein